METLEIIYNDSKVINYLRRKVDDVSSLITNVEKLEQRIYNQLVKYYEFKTKRSFARIRYLIDREIDFVKKEYRLQESTVFSSLAITNDFGESQEFEPHDILANVEDAAILSVERASIRKKIAGLASNDFENFTLNAWATGMSDSEISRTLASRFGGKFDTYRKNVQRFRAVCQRKLAA